VVLRLRFVGDDADAPVSPALEELSDRELEVAQLVAEGLTNGEIGDRLSISAGTVGRHLANIYKRLDIHSRAALTRLVTKG
jgi:DNA-binding NarL/FixJ family response regulator